MKVEPKCHAGQIASLHLLWTFSVLLFLTLVQISFASSVIILCLLVLLGAFGDQVARISSFGRLNMGVNLIWGIGALVLLSQGLIYLGLSPRLAHWITVSALSAVTAFALKGFRKVGNCRTPLEVSHIFAAVSIAILAMSLRHPWLLPFALIVTAVERFTASRSFKSSRRFIALALPALILGYFLSTTLRSSRWWYFYLTGTAGYYEAIASTTSNFGIGEHPGLTGASIAGYHWMSYTFLGSLSVIASLEPWEALTKIGLPILQFCLASLLLAAPSSDNKISLSPLSLMFTLLIIFGTGQVVYDSATFGLVSALCLIGISLEFRNEQRPKLGQLISFFLISVVAVTSKTPTAIATGLVLGLTLITSSQFRRLKSTLPTFVLLCAGIICYILFFHNSMYRTSSTAGSSNSLSTSFWIALNSVPYLGWICVLLVALVALSGFSDFGATKPSQILLICAFVCWLAFSGLSLLTDQGYQLASPTLFVVGAIASSLLQTTLNYAPMLLILSKQKIVVTGLTCLGVGIGFVYPIIVNRTDLVLGLSAAIGSNAWEFVGDYLIYVIPILIVGFALTRPSDDRAFYIVASVALCLGMVAGLQLDRGRRVATYGPDVAIDWPFNDSSLPNDDLMSVGEFVRRTTDPDVIIATNDFCCFGSQWWKDIASNQQLHQEQSLNWWSSLERTQWWNDLEQRIGNEPAGQLSDTLWGGDNYLVSAETQRRILIQGLKFQVLTGLPTDDQVERMNLSLDFANAPSHKVVRGLKRYGVSGYLVNLRLTNQRDWTSYADEMYRSGDFVYLSLR